MHLFTFENYIFRRHIALTKLQYVLWVIKMSILGLKYVKVKGYVSVDYILKHVRLKPVCSKMSHLVTKTTKWQVRAVETQINLGIRPV